MQQSTRMIIRCHLKDEKSKELFDKIFISKGPFRYKSKQDGNKRVFHSIDILNAFMAALNEDKEVTIKSKIDVQRRAGMYMAEYPYTVLINN